MLNSVTELFTGNCTKTLGLHVQTHWLGEEVVSLILRFTVTESVTESLLQLFALSGADE